MENLRGKPKELKRIKVLFVSDTFVPRVDGIVRFIKEVSKRLSPLFEVSFLAPDFHGAIQAAKKMKGKAYLCPPSKFEIEEYPLTAPKNKTIHSAVDPADVVFINSIAPLGARALLYAYSIKKPIVIYTHAIDWELLAFATKFPNRAIEVLKPIIRRMYDKANLILAPNKDVVNILKQGRIKGKFEIVGLGVDTKVFSLDRAMRMKMRKKLNLTDSYVIGFHGRLSREKNIELLYKAFKLFKIHVPNAKLLIVGDGPERAVLKGTKNVILTGFVDNPEDYLQAMDVYVLPSKTETTGLSLMEAMACGLPVIASAVGSIPSYVSNRKNGLLVSPSDLSSALIAKAIRTIHDNPISARRMRDNAVKTVRTFHNWDHTTKKLENIFKRLAKF